VIAFGKLGAVDAENVNYAKNEQISHCSNSTRQRLTFVDLETRKSQHARHGLSRTQHPWVFGGSTPFVPNKLHTEQLSHWRFEPASDYSSDKFLDQIFVRAQNPVYR
jgi:hypothetical protein